MVIPLGLHLGCLLGPGTIRAPAHFEPGPFGTILVPGLLGPYGPQGMWVLWTQAIRVHLGTFVEPMQGPFAQGLGIGLCMGPSTTQCEGLMHEPMYGPLVLFA